MLEENRNQEQAKHWSGLWMSLAFGLALLGGLIALGGCSGNDANSSNTKSGSGTGVRNRMGMELVLVPAGSFQMGAGSGQSGGVEETPAHQVKISSQFYMGKYEVTQAQYQQVMGSNPSYFKNCDQCPVEQVTWNEAQEFIRKLNAMNDGYTYRLPTEAEWEYACRAGTTGEYAGDLDAMAWYDKNSGAKPHPVGQKQPNAFGLSDMHGNVMEFCEDVWHENYNGAPTDGSAWKTGGDSTQRVVRGGSWNEPSYHLTSSTRGRLTPDDRSGVYGFRVVAVPQAK